MKITTKCLVAAVVAAVAIPALASYATLQTQNLYQNNSIWITIYDVAKTSHLDYGCVPPKGTRAWRSGNYLYGSFYYIRGEVKAGKDCSGATLCDTVVRANPQDNTLGTGRPGIGNFFQMTPNGKNCYWD